MTLLAQPLAAVRGKSNSTHASISLSSLRRTAAIFPCVVTVASSLAVLAAIVVGAAQPMQDRGSLAMRIGRTADPGRCGGDAPSKSRFRSGRVASPLEAVEDQVEPE